MVSYEDDDDDVLYAYFLNEVCWENDGVYGSEKGNSRRGFLNGNGSVCEGKEIYDGVSFLLSVVIS